MAVFALHMAILEYVFRGQFAVFSIDEILGILAIVVRLTIAYRYTLECERVAQIYQARSRCRNISLNRAADVPCIVGTYMLTKTATRSAMQMLKDAIQIK